MGLLRGLIFSLLLASTSAWALNNDELFAGAREAYKVRDEAALAEYTRQLHGQNYILAPYADYWLLLLRLSQADHQTVQDFLQRYPDVPFADRVRGEWLKQLGKRQDWQNFVDEYLHFQREDTAVSCYAVEARVALGESEALNSGKQLWHAAGEPPASCDSLFDRMQKAGVLTEQDIWQRFRLAMLEGKFTLAKSIVQRIPGFESAQLKLIDTVNANPQRVLDKKTISLKSRYGRELNLYALDRLARSQMDSALKHWTAIQPSFESADRNYAWARFALYAARKHDPAALQYYTRGSDATLDKEQIAWKVRAALRIKDWPGVQAAIAEMPVAQQQESAWRYWKGRALKEQQQIPQANAIFVPLSHERSYYGLLAEEELGPVMSEPPSFYKASEDDIKEVAAMPGIKRSIELQRVDLRWESRAEWAMATKDFDDRLMIAAAEIAARQEWYDLAIITADKTKFTHDFTLRYPTPYRDLVKSFAKEHNLDEAWVYGLARQESRFIIQAKSGVGAAGLMQVMPATAKWIAKRMGLDSYHNGMIHQLETNIQLGTYYMRHVLDQMGGQALMATAAYNAGPGRAKRWASAQPMEGAIYAETIPFSETRNYVQKVMANAYFYASRLGTRVQSVKQRLGVIAGTSSSVIPEDETILAEQVKAE
jgi:soluble lytic murein transglycosylase